MAALVMSPMQQQRLEEEMAAAARAMFAARLDQQRGVAGAGLAKANLITRHHAHGGQLAAFVAAKGAGLAPPTYQELEDHLGEGFGDWLKKAGKHALTLGKAVVSNKAVQDAAKSVAKAAIKGAQAGADEGGIKGALKGGLAAAAETGKAEAIQLAKDEARRRVKMALAQ